MARVSQLQLGSLYPPPPAWTENYASTESDIDSIMFLEGEEAISKMAAFMQGVGGEIGWANIQRRIMANPAVGLPDVVEWSGERLSEAGGMFANLAEQNWNVGKEELDLEWLETSGISLDVIGKMRAGEARDVFAGALSTFSNAAVSKALEVIVGEAPVVGWVFQLVYSGISLVIRRQAQLEAMDEQSTKPAQTGQKAILPPMGDLSSSQYASLIDRRLLDKIRKTLLPTDGPATKKYESAGVTSQTLDGWARDSDLTAAFCPGFQPSGYVSMTRDAETYESGDLIFASEDDIQGDTRAQGLKAFASRPGDIASGSGVNYIPGLRQIHGWDSLLCLPGGNIPSLYTHPFTSTTQALARLEFQCTKPPWCYMLDTYRIEAEWREAIDRWRDLKSRIYYATQGSVDFWPNVVRPASVEGINLTPQLQQEVVRWSDPGWWLNCSRVIRSDGQNEVERLIPGPILQPRGLYDQPGAMSPGGYVMHPLDYYAGSETTSYRPQPCSKAAEYIDSNGPLPVMDDPWATNPATNSVRRVYMPGEDARWPEPFDPSPESSGRRIWPVVPEGEVVEWTDTRGELGLPGRKVVTGSVLDMAILPWLEKVRASQIYWQQTHWCAYVHPGMPAFEGWNALRFVNAGRFAQLLKSPSRFTLSTADVMDDIGPGSRRELLENAGVCFPGKFVGCAKVQNIPQGPKPPVVVNGFQIGPDVPPVDPDDPPVDPPPVDETPPVPGGDETPGDQPDPVLNPEPPPSSPLPWAIAAAAVGYAATKGKG